MKKNKETKLNRVDIKNADLSTSLRYARDDNTNSTNSASKANILTKLTKLVKLTQANKVNSAKSGFTLIEILISLAILSIILGGITLFSVRTLQSYNRSKAMQNAVENARFAIESLSKKLRTSHDLNFSDCSGGKCKNINFKDNLDNNSYTYEFTGSELKLENIPIVGGGDSNITVTGSFSGVETHIDGGVPANSRRGYVTILITITYDPSGGSGAPSEKDTVNIRSTVSLRDYHSN